MSTTTYRVRCDENHIYWRMTPNGEVREPGFSEICGDLGVTKENKFYTKDGREEGVALHEWLLFLAQGNEPENNPDPRIAGRVEGVKKFIRESGFVFSGGEVALYEPTLGYCCTPDIWGHIGGIPYVIDAKGGAKKKFHKAQTAAQRLALRPSGFVAQKRAALYLMDGDYRLEGHDDVSDEVRWRALVMGYYAKTFYAD